MHVESVYMPVSCSVYVHTAWAGTAWSQEGFHDLEFGLGFGVGSWDGVIGVIKVDNLYTNKM